MIGRRLLPSLYVFALLAVGAPRLAAQASAPAASATPAALTVDPALAQQGRVVWAKQKCSRCHTFGKGALVGPDLRGVMHRHDAAWLRRWLGETDRMLQTDSAAIALMVAFGGVHMPQHALSPQEVEALLYYVARASDFSAAR